jgi:F-type H+-transporting ATPase subunit delta
MKNYLAAQRYAKALSGAIPDPEPLERALSWLQDFAALLADHAELRSVLQNPAIQSTARLAVLDEVLVKTGADPILRSFVHELFRRGRMDIVAEIADVFGRIADQRLNRVTARVTTAQPVTDEQAERIRAGLSSYARKDVRLRIKVDQAIIGGLVVKMDGTVIDGSLRARLKQLRSALLSEENGTI